MPNDNTEQLAYALMKDKNLINKMTGRMLENIRTNSAFSVKKDSKKLEKIEKKLYKCFLKLIVEEDAKKLLELDTLTDHLVTKVEDRTGWSIHEGGAFKETNFKNMEDFEFASWDTYRLYRNKDMGFYVSAAIPVNSYDENIRDYEQSFFDANKEVLEKIHEFYSEKEKIMGGGFTLKNPTPENINMARMIAVYLDYQPEEEPEVSMKM